MRALDRSTAVSSAHDDAASGFTLLEVLLAMAVLVVMIGALSGIYSAITQAHNKGRAIDRSRVAASRVANRSWMGYSAEEAAAGCPENWQVEYQPMLAGDSTNPLAFGRWTFSPSNHNALKTDVYLRSDPF
jgi:prepilin-type N-terminal cleavage/methylation domain-containing protein